MVYMVLFPYKGNKQSPYSPGQTMRIPGG